jgi:spore maturation protein CgeB
VRAGWSHRAWTWHEAADVRVFRPQPGPAVRDDVVFVGNWGDAQRSRELHTFLFQPARALGLSGHVHGVRYPEDGIATVASAGLVYAGYAPDAYAPAIFARHRVSVQVPHQPCARALPGVPSIRMFEALACGIPLVSAPWIDADGLFRVGVDYLLARDTRGMVGHLDAVLHERGLAKSLAQAGRETIAARHTCDHRAAALVAIVDVVRGRASEVA